SLWKQVSQKHLTPAPAIWLCVVAAFLAAIYTGAYAVVTSISVIGLYFSYIIPVYLSWRAKGTALQIERGPWHLGRYSTAVNLIAILWVIFISIILSLPANLRAGKSMLAVTTLLGLWYGLRERRHFRGPRWTPAQP